MNIGTIPGMLKKTAGAFIEDNAMTHGAGLAFYAVLSMAPLLVIIISVAGLAGPDTQERIVEQIQALAGPEAGDVIRVIVANASKERAAGTISAILGILMLLLSASGLFAQLQHSLNVIWDAPPRTGQALWHWARKRALSVAMLAALAVVLLASVAVDTALQVVLRERGSMWQVTNIAISLGVFTVIFAMVFKILPDARIAWSDVWVGAALTALLIAVGKYAIGKYLAFSSVGSAYGAAGSVVVLLVWVYYMSLAFFFGAELTQVYARQYGSQKASASRARGRAR